MRRKSFKTLRLCLTAGLVAVPAMCVGAPQAQALDLLAGVTGQMTEAAQYAGAFLIGLGFIALVANCKFDNTNTQALLGSLGTIVVGVVLATVGKML